MHSLNVIRRINAEAVRTARSPSSQPGTQHAPSTFQRGQLSAPDYLKAQTELNRQASARLDLISLAPTVCRPAKS